MKKIMRILVEVSFLCLIMAAFTVVSHADAEDVPSTIKGYVGNSFDLEAKYDVFIDEIEDTNIYDYDGCFLDTGSTKVYYSDYEDNSGITTVSVKYDPSLRLVADRWEYSNSGKYYYVWVYNISNKTVTFTNETAYYVQKNAKKYNKKFKLTRSSVKINPGQYKKLKFKRKSGKIHYMPSTNKAYMKFKCKYNGKKCTVKLVHGSVNFYKLSGGKWKYIDIIGDYDCFLAIR
ncbi:MAG: hypothetical protein PUB75_01520 [Firmicutes bacterium]|nr:hypothetical protein [Bacillota bacterium]